MRESEHNDDMTSPANATDLEIAIEIIKAAGHLTQTHFLSDALQVAHKDDGTPVTEADRDAETLIRTMLHSYFPEDSIDGEEHADHEGTSTRRWVIDPIDGTKAFTRGVGLYSNLLYLEDEHGPAIGIIYVPALNELVAAGRGLGCWFNGERCTVSDRTDLNTAVLATSGFEEWDEPMILAAHRSELTLRTWGDGYGYVLVATGRAEAMVDAVISFWDIAPCLVIIPEAGGTLTTLAGGDASEATSCIATNGALHEPIRSVLMSGAL